MGTFIAFLFGPVALIAAVGPPTKDHTLKDV